MLQAAVLTASDRSSRGEREDVSGLVLGDLVRGLPAEVVCSLIVPDRVGAISRAIRDITEDGTIRLLITTGGTGVAPRDVTPEATEPLLDRDLPALALAVRWTSYSKAPASIISRAVAGFRGGCLIVNMPGSPRAVEECFAVIRPTLKRLYGRQQVKEGGRQ